MEQITQFYKQHPIKTAAAGLAVASVLGIKNFTRGGMNKYRTSLDGKVIILTGGTSGIGKEAAKYFYKVGADVVITGRNAAAAEKIIDSLPAPKAGKQAKMRFERVDFADVNNVKAFADKMLKDYEKLDVLVNNAGLFLTSYNTTKQGLEMTMGVNHIAPVYLTSLLFPLLNKGHEARIINVSSRAHKRLKRNNARGKPFEEDFWQNLDDVKYTPENFGHFNTYCWSKLANLWFTKHLSNLIEKHNGDFEAEKKFNIRVVSLHPGLVASGFLRDMGGSFKTVAYALYPLVWLIFKSEWEGCQSILTTVLCPFEKLVPGGYYNDCVDFPATQFACDEERQNWCWKVTAAKIEELTGGYKIFQGL